jgi:hypothetical protein
VKEVSITLKLSRSENKEFKERPTIKSQIKYVKKL